MTNPQGTPIWYELITPDPDAAKTFYDAVVGWTIEAQPAGEVDYRMVSDAGGHAGGVMRLSDDMAAHGARPGWLMYLGVEDVDGVAEQVKAAGGSVLVAPWSIPGVGRMALVADPQGAPFYLMRGETEGATSTVFSPTAERRVGWNELATTDQPGALAFYAELFGWTVPRTMPMGDLGDYSFLMAGDLPLGAAMSRAPGGPPPAWRFYVRVPDIDTAAEAVRSGGGAIQHGPVEVPGGDLVVVATDPQGAAFGLVGKRRGQQA